LLGPHLSTPFPFRWPCARVLQTLACGPAPQLHARATPTGRWGPPFSLPTRVSREAEYASASTCAVVPLARGPLLAGRPLPDAASRNELRFWRRAERGRLHRFSMFCAECWISLAKLVLDRSARSGEGLRRRWPSLRECRAWSSPPLTEFPPSSVVGSVAVAAELRYRAGVSYLLAATQTRGWQRNPRTSRGRECWASRVFVLVRRWRISTNKGAKSVR
jgi:hypothetical protein